MDITIKAPWNAFATSEGVIDRCGAMGAAVYTTGAGGADTNPLNSWASVTGPDFATGDFTLKINTALAMTLIGDAAEVDETLYIKTHLKDYTAVKQYTSIVIKITAPACNCASMLWTNPSPTAVTVAVASTDTPAFPLPIQDTANTANDATFAKCFLAGGTCPSTGTFPIANVKYADGTSSGAALSGYTWLTITQSADNTQTLNVAPVAASHIGVHNIIVNFDSTFGPNPTYTALTITVTCQVTSITPPAAPVSDLSYSVYEASNTVHDFTTAAYVQTPPCNYAVTNNF